MSTAIGFSSGIGMRILAMAVASSFNGSNAIRIKPPPEPGESWDKPVIKLPGMSPRDFARYRSKCGRPRKKKNLHHCARLAKVKRRTN